MGFRLQQKLMTLNDFERQFTALPSQFCVFLTKRLRLESRGFRYKVALYLSYLHIIYNFISPYGSTKIKNNTNTKYIK